MSSQLFFFAAMLLVFFIPGFLLLKALRFGRYFSLLEFFTVSFAASVGITDFVMIILGKTGIVITKISLLSSILILSAACAIIIFIRRKKNPGSEKAKDDGFSKRSTVAILLLIFLTIFIKTLYLENSIAPTSTDLGHHMYWSKQIAITGELPIYEKTNIQEDFTISQPEPMADFIIGEHLLFAAIAVLSGANFISSFPSLILFLIHIMSVIAIFLLAREAFKKSENRDIIAITALFFIGPLYALASPQAKYVSGGVVGNIIGNFLIPLSVFLFIKAFSEKKPRILALAIFSVLIMAYTHHLSTFIFLFISLFTAIAFIALNLKTLRQDIKEVLRMFFSREIIAIVIFALISVFFLYTPTYMNKEAVDVAVGTPIKSTRTGLTMEQLKMTAGEARFVFAFFGLVFLLFTRHLGKYNQAFAVGWLAAIMMMSLKPQWLFVDIPTNRIASYVVFPTSVISAFMLVSVFHAIKDSDKRRSYLKNSFLLSTFFIFLVFLSIDGLRDNSLALSSDPMKTIKKSSETYAASRYLSEHSSENDMILKDHNYLSGDSWIKLFFMRGYNYPLSRGYFKRYEDELKPREQCTNLMISLPKSNDAEKCYAGTKTNFIMINPNNDAAQFNRIKNFWQVYSSDEVGIFYKSY
ncbi:MAG: DUF1616 domain-containing protein [Candidatus Moranbacteria bacterium]|jgi:hypothetical protein|nr:DUF1616 domain-containing protein [Candidatus Moranbacteria bacterium]